MLQIFPEQGPLTPHELLNLTPKEAALLEAFRGLFEAIKIIGSDGFPMKNAGSGITDVVRGDEIKQPYLPGITAVINEKDHHFYLTARVLYLELRDRYAEEKSRLGREK